MHSNEKAINTYCIPYAEADRPTFFASLSNMLKALGDCISVETTAGTDLERWVNMTITVIKVAWLIVLLLTALMMAVPTAHANAVGGLCITSVTADRTSAAIGDTVIWTAAASGSSGAIQYHFILYKDNEVLVSGDASPSAVFSLALSEEGTYQVIVYAKDALQSASCASGYLPVIQEHLTVQSVTANQVSAAVGDAISWTTHASGGSGTKYYGFFLYKDDILLSYHDTGTSNTFSFEPTSQGAYKVDAHVGDAHDKAHRESASILVKPSEEFRVVSVAANKTDVNVGETVIWTAITSGGSGTGVKTHVFFLYKDDVLMSYHDTGSANTFSYVPTAAGTYKVHVHTGNAQEKADLISGSVVAFGVSILGVTADTSSGTVGGAITWTASTSGSSGTLRFMFVLYKDGQLVTYNDTAASNAYTYTPATAGWYKVIAYVSDSSHTVSCASGEIPVVPSHLAIAEISASQISAAVGETITWTLSAVGGSGTKLYGFFLYRGNEMVTFSGSSTYNTFSYTPTVCETYWVHAFVSDEYEKANMKSNGIYVTGSGGLHVLSITPDKTKAVVGDTITWKVSTIGGAGPIVYRYMVLQNQYHHHAEVDYVSSNTFSFTPKEEGSYMLEVEVLDTKLMVPNNRGGTVVVSAVSLNPSTLMLRPDIPPNLLLVPDTATPAPTSTIAPNVIKIPSPIRRHTPATPKPTQKPALIPIRPIIRLP